MKYALIVLLLSGCMPTCNNHCYVGWNGSPPTQATQGTAE